MDKKDLTISNDDLADIFGGGDLSAFAKASASAAASADKPADKSAFGKPSAPAMDKPLDDRKVLQDLPEINAEPAKKTVSAPAPAAAKKEEFSKKAPAPPVKSKLVLDRAEEAFRAQELAAAQAAKKTVPSEITPSKEEHSVDDLIKRAQEIEKQMNAPQETSLAFKDFIDEKTVAEMIHAFNDLKAAFSKELAGKIDQRSVDNMMLRTLEKTAVNFMLLKNTSWDTEGQLKQDGSIDTDRFVKNMSSCREQIQEIDKEIGETLKALMFMRLIAVKKGLGADKYAEIKNGLVRRSAAVEGGYKKAVSNFIKKNIMEDSMRKADEEK